MVVAPAGMTFTSSGFRVPLDSKSLGASEFKYYKGREKNGCMISFDQQVMGEMMNIGSDSFGCTKLEG